MLITEEIVCVEWVDTGILYFLLNFSVSLKLL